MKSCSSTSSIVERVIRARSPIWRRASEIAGSDALLSQPQTLSVSGTYPPDGSQSSFTAKRTISMSPSQKLGSDTPSRATVISAWSSQVLGRSDANTPLVMPIDEGQDQRVQRQRQRHGQPLDDGPRDAPSQEDRVAEVAPGHALVPAHELDEHGPVQAQLVPDALHLLRRRARARR